MDFQNTDLALEVQEQFEENQVEVPGVVLRKKRSADGKVLTNIGFRNLGYMQYDNFCRNFR